ncbi:hypothetical protein AHAS_Ahas03G0221800 [Arachis hypogaea]
MHDFKITENFVVVPDQQVVFKVGKIKMGGSPIVYDKEKVSQFEILDKNSTDSDSIRWIVVPKCLCIHLWNAWQEK